MVSRTYGWVQNPSDFESLKRTVQIFDPNSSHYKELRDSLVPDLVPIESVKNEFLKLLNSDTEKFTYKQLVGGKVNAEGKSASARKFAVADGLIQLSIPSQSESTSGKRWTDNWTADGFYRWALTLGFIKLDRVTDTCEITISGKKFAGSSSRLDQDPNLIDAILKYPPAIRVLTLLQEFDSLNKFQMGQLLGFKGEKGFTSYKPELMDDALLNSGKEEQKKIRSDWEGSADKYARMISTWLLKLGLVSKSKPMIRGFGNTTFGFLEYSLTIRGTRALAQAQGISKHKRKEKFVEWEFLATAARNRDYLRTRRAYILKILASTKSLQVLLNNLKDLGFNESEQEIIRDIEGLNNIGIVIEIENNKVVLRDRIVGLTIPQFAVNPVLEDYAFSNAKNEVVSRTNLPSKYYELFDIAYDGKRNRDFEMLAIDLLINVYGFQGKVLGGGLKPDGIVYSSDLKYGFIVDTKAYKDGYPKAKSQEDEMVRYVEDNLTRDVRLNRTKWWEGFDVVVPQPNIYFLWISSYFKPRFSDQLGSTSARTKVNGAAINARNLLIGADMIQKNELTLSDFKALIKNVEIEFD